MPSDSERHEEEMWVLLARPLGGLLIDGWEREWFVRKADTMEAMEVVASHGGGGRHFDHD